MVSVLPPPAFKIISVAYKIQALAPILIQNMLFDYLLLFCGLYGSSSYLQIFLHCLYEAHNKQGP